MKNSGLIIVVLGVVLVWFLLTKSTSAALRPGTRSRLKPGQVPGTAASVGLGATLAGILAKLTQPTKPQAQQGGSGGKSMGGGGGPVSGGGASANKNQCLQNPCCTTTLPCGAPVLPCNKFCHPLADCYPVAACNNAPIPCTVPTSVLGPGPCTSGVLSGILCAPVPTVLGPCCVVQGGGGTFNSCCFGSSSCFQVAGC